MEITVNVFAKMSFLVLSFSQQILTLLHLNLFGVSLILIKVWKVNIASSCQQYYKNVRKKTKKAQFLQPLSTKLVIDNTVLNVILNLVRSGCLVSKGKRRKAGGGKKAEPRCQHFVLCASVSFSRKCKCRPRQA